MNYEAKNFERLLGTVGFSDVLLRNHFTLYEGYVSNTNKIHGFLKTADVGTPPYSELKRRFGWEWNGMRLHELYFGNMIKGGSDLLSSRQRVFAKGLKHAGSESADSVLFAKKIEEDFGSVENWEKDFRATGAMRGIGWVVLACDTETGKLFNLWINEHDGGHLVCTEIILVMDVFEHAFALDYGIKRADYISAFWNAIDWQVVSARFLAVK
ncbi:MAG: superoxide dismutase [Candidatus Yonathbacteria bacterium CG10_big_fil_rev_8_21_14_0_10_43_136]|uniref:superoxide dismutase n=2 Tax=Parcubacteria group TaxID=1794811 RepID=A0A2M7Q5X5_9BACT|nr:MAG: superoxide dismutase [Candidatus Nomurabacteria bacterium CG2_30_43_9]PIQ36007.1 MAG: superoxide dismutase [Candidatus Yonathbacteria bacterium CG17_big_fil_post_rev_8_21_14_2_50_43_9]PIR40871.1 MAG: superoxide dismutase [Candidatus Yonathbacteria bacterium CG10_big_fil_rev_8_21_14_0_10_43_136]PIX57121.1 MAG: superoxide dismutase [Candidatus Yonathbacteria bacterium CG_4_10_14_3_um_filter_43_12]PIY58470.1 MAG: superoxide dismutase [Candidatus Yonathbacteria bacterium CG_4_10_14_0_8_um_f